MRYDRHSAKYTNIPQAHQHHADPQKGNVEIEAFKDSRIIQKAGLEKKGVIDLWACERVKVLPDGPNTAGRNSTAEQLPSLQA